MVGSPVSGFMPVPLAMMIPFMAAQSMLMGDAFGRSFQYGKRKISAMSNEEFNVYNPKDMISEMTTTYNALIPELSQMIKDSKDFQTFIFAQLLDMPREMLAQLFGAVARPESQATSGDIGKDIEAKIKEGLPFKDPNLDPDKFQPPSQFSKVEINMFKKWRTADLKIGVLTKQMKTAQGRKRNLIRVQLKSTMFTLQTILKWAKGSKGAFIKYQKWLRANP